MCRKAPSDEGRCFGSAVVAAIQRILERKEVERSANRGAFLWGIGNSVAPGVAELVNRLERPEVLFGPIRSRPRRTDVEPESVLRWTACETLFGERFQLPDSMCVTSRGSSIGEVRPHYALVCSSDEPLEFADFGCLRFRALRNLLSGSAVGASQVTAVVNHAAEETLGGPEYKVALRASLIAPYFVRLRDPVRRAGAVDVSQEFSVDPWALGARVDRVDLTCSALQLS